MSRYVLQKGNLEIAYGFDRMTPLGGYFFQVFDLSKKVEDWKTEEENEEALKVDPSGNGMVLNKGFVKGISRSAMLELMETYGVNNKKHIDSIVLDLPI